MLLTLLLFVVVPAALFVLGTVWLTVGWIRDRDRDDGDTGC